MATTGELTNALEGLQAIAEAMEAALNQVGYGELDEPGDAEDVSTGPFTDEQYLDALETLGSLLEAGEGLLEGVGMDDPDDAEDSTGDDAAGRAEEQTEAVARAATSNGVIGPGGSYGNWRL